MARHETLPLTPDQIATVNANRALLTVGAHVFFTYTKRDTGTVSARSGVVLRYAGQPNMSNAAVWVDTPDGERQFNLYLISNVRTA